MSSSPFPHLNTHACATLVQNTLQLKRPDGCTSSFPLPHLNTHACATLVHITLQLRPPEWSSAATAGACLPVAAGAGLRAVLVGRKGGLGSVRLYRVFTGPAGQEVPPALCLVGRDYGEGATACHRRPHDMTVIAASLVLAAENKRLHHVRLSALSNPFNTFPHPPHLRSGPLG